ncbi:uncharacterized protein BT62DRAFT_921592 [Guyanagaster necrorhizus]|uniref:Uncharacterized protein n=1 Tax=Guyanagaster necrorhizus TaxID=856835 RepID=A0A9P7VNS1_9AGAR|nr:uncharacterized protein BT62DRAFT_921592 [Guyanagaster necrorhizus MCA 3950]KAG7443950.1 hypothetical protein BT62DRAFT_921592 [Guyanagaster necrorhizus MCA 3950]
MKYFIGNSWLYVFHYGLSPLEIGLEVKWNSRPSERFKAFISMLDSRNHTISPDANGENYTNCDSTNWLGLAATISFTERTQMVNLRIIRATHRYSTSWNLVINYMNYKLITPWVWLFSRDTCKVSLMERWNGFHEVLSKHMYLSLLKTVRRVKCLDFAKK